MPERSKICGRSKFSFWSYRLEVGCGANYSYITPEKFIVTKPWRRSRSTQGFVSSKAEEEMTDVERRILVGNSCPCISRCYRKLHAWSSHNVSCCRHNVWHFTLSRLFSVLLPKSAFKSNIFLYSNLNVSTLLLSVLDLSSFYSNLAGHVRLATIDMLCLKHL